MLDGSNSKRRTVLVVCLGVATLAGITGLQLVDDAPSRSPLEPTTTTTTATQGVARDE